MKERLLFCGVDSWRNLNSEWSDGLFLNGQDVRLSQKKKKNPGQFGDEMTPQIVLLEHQIGQAW